MNDEDRRLKEESERREQRHWPWVGNWPQMKNVTVHREKKGCLSERHEEPMAGNQIKKPLYPPTYDPQKPDPIESLGCAIESEYRYKPLCTDLSGFKRTPPMWQNVRRPDGVLELRNPTGSTLETQTLNAKETVTNSLLPNIVDEPPEDDDWICKAYVRSGWPKLNEDGYDEDYDMRFTAHYNPNLSNEVFSDYGHLSDLELDEMVGKINRERIRRINNPEDNPAIEHFRKFKLSALNALSNPRGNGFLNITKEKTFIGKDGISHAYLVWNVYPDQIEPDHLSGKMWLEQKTVERAYWALWGKEEFQDLLKTPPNCPYQPWHWWLIALRAPIAKNTGLDSRAVDRALCRMAKKRIKRDARIKNDWSTAYSSVDLWHFYLEHIEGEKKEFGPEWFRYEESFWTGALERTYGQLPADEFSCMSIR